MAEKRRFLDVWLVEPNTVYREVPYTVVADWIQQSRLVPDDMLRPSGTAQWYKVGESPEFMPYLPQADPMAIEDDASSREPIDLGFSWKRRRDDEDDDPDMIPLIDVSLVLLVFFMLTATPAISAAFVDRPEVQVPGALEIDDSMIFFNVRVDVKEFDDGFREKTHWFSVSYGKEDPNQAAEFLKIPPVIEDFKKTASRFNLQAVNVTIRADKNADAGAVKQLLVALTGLGARSIHTKYFAVTKKE